MSEKLAGAFVVVVATRDATRAGRLADELRAHGGRVAVFVDEDDDGDTDALVELVAELGVRPERPGAERPVK